MLSGVIADIVVCFLVFGYLYVVFIFYFLVALKNLVIDYIAGRAFGGDFKCTEEVVSRVGVSKYAELAPAEICVWKFERSLRRECFSSGRFICISRVRGG